MKSSGIFMRDGSLFIQNVLPDSPGTRIGHAVGEWVRSGNREFDLTWIFIVVSSADGSYVGTFKNRGKVRYNSDATQLDGSYSFDYMLADGTKVFAGTGKVKATRIRVEPM